MKKGTDYSISGIVILMCIFPAVVFSQDTVKEKPKVVWSCTKAGGGESILWLVEAGKESYIKVFDERIPADYSMDGLEKRWNWDLDRSENSYNYAITLGPDLVASYYEFRTSKDGTAKASAFYKCKK